MAIKNVEVVNTASKYIVKSTGVKSETNEILVNAEELTEGTGTLSFIAESEEHNLALRGKGKYGLRPNELKFGSDKQINISTDARVKSYLLVTEFRRNN